jgi:DNA modification methylase
MELLGAHPTIKPVALVADALRDVSRRGEIVIDPFLGAGSTLLAAEETGRVCIGVEIDPAYVEVAIGRWQKRTGRAVTGETFQAALERRDAERAPPLPAEPITVVALAGDAASEEQADG